MKGIGQAAALILNGFKRGGLFPFRRNDFIQQALKFVTERYNLPFRIELRFQLDLAGLTHRPATQKAFTIQRAANDFAVTLGQRPVASGEILAIVPTESDANEAVDFRLGANDKCGRRVFPGVGRSRLGRRTASWLEAWTGSRRVIASGIVNAHNDELPVTETTHPCVRVLDMCRQRRNEGGEFREQRGVVQRGLVSGYCRTASQRFSARCGWAIGIFTA